MATTQSGTHVVYQEKVRPSIGMWILERVSPEAVWLSCAVAGVVAAGLFLGAAARLQARLGDRGRPA